MGKIPAPSNHEEKRAKFCKNQLEKQGSKYIAQNNLVPKNVGMLIVANADEEGLGNLKGCKKIFEKYGDRVTELVTFDGLFGTKLNICGNIATIDL